MIKTVKKATDQEWDRIVDAVPTALYSQTREWFHIWTEYAGFENKTLLFRFVNGKEVLLPLARLRLLHGLIPIYFLSPKGMGGFVTNDTLDLQEKIELFAVLKRMTIAYFAINPFDTRTNEICAETPEDFTQVLDLRIGFDRLFRTWSTGHSSAVRKGIREGVTVHLAVTEDDWKDYFAVYKESLARWSSKATNAYSWDLFRIMHGMHSAKIRLWLAKYRGQVISGALCLYHNKHIAGWHGSTLHEYFHLNAFHVLQYHIIQDACRREFHIFDFMPSSGHEGVVHFKNGFNALKKPVHVYVSKMMQVAVGVRKTMRNSLFYRWLVRGTGF